MNKAIIFKFHVLLLLVSFSSFKSLNAQESDISDAFNFLNEIRSTPGNFSKIVGVSLGDVTPRKPLIWNQTLAMVAQKKAEDLANRNYFSHVNPDGYGINFFIQRAGYTLPKEWTDNIANNNCESLSAGSSSPKDGIIQLINDGGFSDHKLAGHRVHLLGIDDFFAKAYDIGIGWASNPNSTYRNYLVVITARHTW